MLFNMQPAQEAEEQHVAQELQVANLWNRPSPNSIQSPLHPIVSGNNYFPPHTYTTSNHEIPTEEKHVLYLNIHPRIVHSVLVKLIFLLTIT